MDEFIIHDDGSASLFLDSRIKPPDRSPHVTEKEERSDANQVFRCGESPQVEYDDARAVAGSESQGGLAVPQRLERPTR
jgi:hypothetical protein